MNETLTIVSIIMHLISIPLIVYLIHHHREHRKMVMEHIRNIELHMEYLEDLNGKRK